MYFYFFFAVVFQNTCSLMLTKLVHAGLDEMHNIQKCVTVFQQLYPTEANWCQVKKYLFYYTLMLNTEV